MEKNLPKHHRGGKFQNNYGDFEPKSLADVLRWRWDATRKGLPKPPGTPIPAVSPDLEFIRSNSLAGSEMQPAVTWIGHATSLVQMSGISLLTDPIFSQRASPISFAGPKRHQPAGIALPDLPHIDLVVVSHNHYDHLDLPSVKTLSEQNGGSALFVVPLGLAQWFRKHGVDQVVELDWWQSHSMQSPGGEVEIVLVPAQHWSARGLGDRMMTLWGGFAIFSNDMHLFFAGDTGYSRDFLDMREKFRDRQSLQRGGGFDLALLPIGAYEPRWFMQTQHVNVAEAVKIHLDLGAKKSMGVHWGTFQLTDEPLDEPPRVLTQRLADCGLDQQDFFTLAIGETRRISPRWATGSA